MKALPMDTILPGASRGAHCLADDLLRLDPALRPSATLAQTHNFFTQEPLPASSESLRPGVNGAHQGDVASERATSSSDIKGVGCTGGGGFTRAAVEPWASRCTAHSSCRYISRQRGGPGVVFSSAIRISHWHALRSKKKKKKHPERGRSNSSSSSRAKTKSHTRAYTHVWACGSAGGHGAWCMVRRGCVFLSLKSFFRLPIKSYCSFGLGEILGVVGWQ